MTVISVEANSPDFDFNKLHQDFSGTGAQERSIGVEGEYLIVSPETLAYARGEEIIRLQQNLSKLSSHTEAAGVLEYASAPHAVTDLDQLIVKAMDAENQINQAAAESGLSILPCSVPPFTTLDEAEEKMIGRERVVDMVDSVRALLHPDALKVGFLTASVQVSLTYSDPQDLYRTLYRGTALSSALIALFASDTGRADGQVYSGHIRSVFYRAYPTHEFGIPTYLQKVTDVDDLIQHHIEGICKAPLLYYYDRAGKMHKGDLSLTFNSLADMDLQTEKNFALAESFLYPDIKFKPLPEGGRRLEFRTPDSGPAQMAAGAALVGKLLGTEQGAKEFDKILSRFGFGGNFAADYDLLTQTRASSVERIGDLDQTQFGTGTMRDFQKAVRGICAGSSPSSLAITPFLAPNFVPLTARYRSMDDEQLAKALRPTLN